MKWFKHMSKANRDTKIKKLINEFGAEGYAVYFYCLELIASDLEYDNITFELEDDVELVGQFLKTDTLKVEKIMKKCIELGLFGMSEAGKITCLKIAKFLDERFTRNPELKKMIKSDKMSEIRNRLSEDKMRQIPDMSDQIRLAQISTEQNSIEINNKPSYDGHNTDKNKKKTIRKKYNEYEDIKAYRENVLIREKDYSTLISEYSKESIERVLDKLSHYKYAHDKSYASDYGAIREWVIDSLKIKKITDNIIDGISDAEREYLKKQMETNIDMTEQW